MSSATYHRGELNAALDPNHPGHLLPPDLPIGHRVLDIGCGAGQTLIAAYPNRISFGLDPDMEALRLGRSLTDRIQFACGRSEMLPYRDEQFEMAIARVSLPYTNINASLKEIRRVLKKGGAIWMVLHPFSVPWKQVKRSNFKGKIFFAYVLLNSMAFDLLQGQFPFLGRYESFQTERGITKALGKNGFGEVSITRGRHFVVTARASDSVAPI
jgi:ubiquinone/menaquinone biosynthesis C-methylase UbiE